ncbi:MAG TPA: asparagine synthase (glutamine-hydrolyzing) [Pirellulales bacterium]|nr:asparagine synthase (glutamine-hydrolyzing) [Pirellulales bacterium]
MCGLAGILDLRGRREVDGAALARMAAALVHRGPDEDGFWQEAGLGLASRRLSIVGLADGRQPIWNEDRTVAVVFNGELFEYPELRAELSAKRHRLATSCDTELVVHLWEDLAESMFSRLRGQFALALWDRRRRRLVLARDRVGICPLYWSRQVDWLYFASEIKALLATGGVPLAVDARGIDHAFTFFAMPARRTAFEGISSLLPGKFLDIELRDDGEPAEVREREYWDLDFPDRGDEDDPPDPQALVDEFSRTLRRAVELRLRADVPVVSYLSGGTDSATVLAMTSQLRGAPVPSFTIRLTPKELDESRRALAICQGLGGQSTVVDCDAGTLAAAYPAVVRAADSPVVDAAAAGLFCQAREVQRQGFKVALTGEGADEALAGYPWFKVHKLLGLADFGPCRPSHWLRHAAARILAPGARYAHYRQLHQRIGGPYAQGDVYALVSTLRRRFYSGAMCDRLAGHTAFDDLELDRRRISRWHPLNQSLYFGYKTMLPGLLLSQRGDRIAMANSVETRYPFLDDDLIALCARVHPRWKLRGLRGDKRLLRLAAGKLLPLRWRGGENRCFAPRRATPSSPIRRRTWSNCSAKNRCGERNTSTLPRSARPSPSVTRCGRAHRGGSSSTWD